MTKLRLFKKKKIDKKKVLFWGIITIVYFVRLLYIDADIRAPWGVLNYQPFDEGCYGALALHKMDFGTINPNNYYNGTYEYLNAAHVINNLVGNIFSYFTMTIFGDNYLGFRLGPILAGYIIIILFVLVLDELILKYKKKYDVKLTITFFLFIIYLLFNFVFYNASRIVEPTLYRLLFLQLIIFIYFKQNIPKNIKNFLISFLSVFSVFFVYITNLFIGLPIAAIFLFYLFSHQSKEAKQYLIWNLSGGICAYFVSLVYYYFIWNTMPIKNVLDAIFSFQSVPGYNIVKVSLWDKTINFLSSNIFLYNPILIAVFFLSLPYYINRIIREKDKNILFLLSFVLGLFIQTLISEDYIVRKSLVIFPVIIYLNFIFIITKQNTSEEKINLKYSKKCFYLVLGLCIILIQLYCVLYRVFFIDNGTNLDFSRMDILIIIILSGISSCYIIIDTITKNGSHKNTIRLFYFCLVSTIILNSVFIFKYNFYKNTYSDRKIMQQLGEFVDGKIVCFSYENSNTLYNNILPLMCSETQILEYMKKNPDIFYYGFEDFPTFNLDENSLNQHVKVYHRFDREFETFGVKRKFALFQYKE